MCNSCGSVVVPNVRVPAIALMNANKPASAILRSTFKELSVQREIILGPFAGGLSKYVNHNGETWSYYMTHRVCKYTY